MLAVDDGKKLSYADYNFTTTLEQTQDRTRNAKDRLHLIKELAVMATSLPPGVWVRVDEIRNDAMYADLSYPASSCAELPSAVRSSLLVPKELHTPAAYSSSIALCP